MKKIIKEFITVTKAAEILGVSPPAVFNANRRGKLLMYEVDGGTKILKLQDVLKYKKNRKRGRPPVKNKKKT